MTRRRISVPAQERHPSIASVDSAWKSGILRGPLKWVGLLLAMVLTLIGPEVAWASQACTDINTGKYNFSVKMTNGVASNNTGLSYTGSNGNIINAFSNVNENLSTDYATYSFTPGDKITMSITSTGKVTAAFGYTRFSDSSWTYLPYDNVNGDPGAVESTPSSISYTVEAGTSFTDPTALAAFNVTLGGGWPDENGTATATLTCTPAAAAVTAPTIASALGNATITTDSSSSTTLTYTLTNTNAATAMTNVSMANVTLPTGVSATVQSQSCTSGTNGTANVSGSTLSYSGGSFTASSSSSCTVVFNLKSGSIGSYNFGSSTASAVASGTTYTSSASSNVALTVTAGAPTHFTVSASPASVASGTALSSVTVTALDAHGNTVTSYTGIVHFTSTDGQATLPANYTFTGADNGVHTFTGVTLKTVGASQTITATDTVTSSITGTSANIAVTAGAATHFTVSASPASVTAGTALTGVTVTALDANGNIVTGYIGTVHFTSTDAQATLPSNYAFTGADNGVHTFTGVTLKTSGAAQTITATDTVTSSITGTTNTITVNPASAIAVVVSSGNPQTTAVGTAFSNPLVVLVKDAYGNAVGSGVTVTFTAPSSGQSATFSSGNTAQTNGSGIATLAAPTANSSAGAYTVTASVSGGTTSASFSLTNSAGAPASIAVSTGNNQTAAISTAFATPLSVIVKDALANPISGVSVTFNAPGSGASGTFAGSATVNTNSSGVATAPAFTANGTAGNYSVVASVGGLGSTASFSLTNSAIPTVTSLSTSAGATGGGTTVVITGTNLTGATAVQFGSTAATSYTVNSATQITATAPAGSAGTVDITVTTTFGTSATSASDQFTYTAAPTVTSVSPASGSVSGGGSVTISGANLSSAIAVKFGSTAAASITSNSATQIVVPAPAGSAGTVDITVTTAGGTSVTSASDRYTYVAPPTAGAVTASVGYNASNAAINLVLGGGTAASVAVSTQATHGVATASGTAITYTPTTGYIGSDTFYYTATNPGGTSSPATVTVTVGAPTFTTNLTGSGATQNQPIASYAITTSGGNAPYSCNTTPASGSLPSGVTLGSNCTLSGTPAVNGSFSFTVQVTDSSTGTGPSTQTSGQLTLNVAAGTPASIAISAGNSQTTAISTAFATQMAVVVKDASNNPLPGASVTFTAPGSGASGTFGGSATVTTNASGIATAPAFTANATAGGYTVVASVVGLGSTASFSLTNQAGPASNITVTGGGSQSTPVLTPFGAQLSVTVTDSGGNPLGGQNVTFTAPGSGASGTFSTSQFASLIFKPRMMAAGFVQVAAGPSSNPIIVQTNASGVASVYFKANGIVGSYSVTAAVGGATTTFSLSNTKQASTITFNPLPAMAQGSAPVTLTATSTSGDTVVFTSSTPTVCTVSGATLSLVVGASGNCVITASDPGNATYAAATPVTQSFQVTARPDPSKDPEVIGLITAQTQAAEQFGQIQLQNFNSRLEQMHGDGYVNDSFGLSLTDGLDHADDTPRRSGYADETSQPSSTAAAADQATGKALKKENKNPTLDDKAKAAALDRAFSFWTAGAIQVGRIHNNNTVSTTDLSTGGLSAGVDYRFNQLISLGFGLGYGSMRSEIGTNGTTTSGRNYDAVLYASIRPTNYAFIDLVGGAGLLDFSSTRYITGVGGFAQGKRNGHEFFGSATGGVEIKTKQYMVSPYIRFDAKTGTLNAFDENGPSPWTLHYDKETFSTASVNLGIKAAIKLKNDLEFMTPFMRTEFQHDLINNTAAGVTYADLNGTGTDYAVTLPGADTNRILLGVGTDMTYEDFKLTLEYLNTLSTSSKTDVSSYRFKVTKPF